MAERSRMSPSRRSQLKSLLLHIGKSMLEEEAQRAEEEKLQYMEAQCPALPAPCCLQEVQELCRRLHQQIDVVEEERYDMEVRLSKSNKEMEELKMAVQELKGRLQKPVLRRVRVSADALLGALLGCRHRVGLDLRAGLRQVRKEAREEQKQTSDWRKNVEDKSGMGGRKKMFEAET